MDMIEDGTSYFPIEVLYHSGRKAIVEKPEDLEGGEAFKVLRTKVEVPKINIINTGVPKVWGGSEAP